MRDFIDVPQGLDKFLVVGDDNEHKVALVHPLLDYLPERRAQRFYILVVQVSRWFIQR